MPGKMIDLSVPLENGGAPDPAGRPKIETRPTGKPLPI